jgi:hypothetical protein
VNDAYAFKALQAISDDGSQWLKDRASIFGILKRTLCFKNRAIDFLQEHRQQYRFKFRLWFIELFSMA